MYSMPGDWGTDGNPEDGIPVLRSTNFRNSGHIDFSDIAYRKVEERRLDKRRISKGTILIEKSGGSPSQPAGRVVYCDRDFKGTASNFIEVVKVKAAFSSQYVAFLLYYLYQVGLVLKYQQQTTGIINFKLNEYCEETINCPDSKQEQTKIAEVLSTVDQAIEQTEALIAKQQSIKTGLMQDLLTRGIDEHGNLRSEQTHKFKDSQLGRIPVEWEVQRIGNLLVNIKQGWSPDCNSDPASIGEWGVLKTTAVTWQGYSEIENKALPESLKPRSSLEITTGDLLMTRAGPNSRVGVVAYVYRTRNKLILSDKIYRLIPSEIMDGRFLYYALSSFQTQKHLSNLKTGMAESQTNISQEIANSLLTVVPNKEEQASIADRLDQIATGIKQFSETLTKLRSLKTALMQDLLTGKKRVTPLLNEMEVRNG